VPGSPTNVRAATGVTSGEIFVSWDAPTSTGGAAITDYRIEYRPAAGGAWTTFADGVSTATSATLKLTSGVSYAIRVAALSSSGTGVASGPTAAVTASTGVTMQFVTVGDAGNAADTNPAGYGTVDYEYRIGTFEVTNAQYAAFLNAVDPQGTNPNLIYNAKMGTDARGGITNTGTTNGSRYGVKANMGDKPVVYVSWFDAARFANWLHAGGLTYATTDSSATAPQNTGGYPVGTATSGVSVAKNPGARFTIPTEDEWYKAAYYKGVSTNAGYWDYATRSDNAPTAVTANSTGVGSAGGTGNFVNHKQVADWNGQDGNVTTVGSNGGPGFYGTFDQTGNVSEWNDLTGVAGSSRGLRGGKWNDDAFFLSSSIRNELDPSLEGSSIGFRLASPCRLTQARSCGVREPSFRPLRRQRLVAGTTPTARAAE